MTVLANFSSPVIIENTHSYSDLIQIAMHDRDAFNRWDAIQRLYSLAVNQFQDDVEQDLSWLDKVVEHLLFNAIQKAEESAEYLTIPSLESLIQERNNVDVIALVDARSALCKHLAHTHYAQLEAVFMQLTHQQYAYNQEQVNTRKLRKALLGLMGYNQESLSHIETLYADSDNMTDTLCALTAAQYCNVHVFNSLMTEFESKWREDSLVIDKWYGLHATTERNDILSQLTLLQQHPRFTIDNPNRVRALIGSFAFYNKRGFHAVDGSGYRFLTDYLLKLDTVNPQVASRLVTPLTQFQNLASTHQQKMREQLSRLLTHKGLSKDVFEKVSKALAYDSNA